MRELGFILGSAIALLIAAAGANAASTDVNIDYSHSVVGTGTIMTNSKMGSAESTEAIREVHGTGLVTDRYIFQSNNSQNVTIQDRFLFTKTPAYREITIRDYPAMNRTLTDLRLLGTIWAEKINLTIPRTHFRSAEKIY